MCRGGRVGCGPQMPAPLFIVTFGVVVALPSASALHLDYTQLPEGSPRPLSENDMSGKVMTGKERPEHDVEGKREDDKGKTDGLPGIAGLPPPQSGIAQLLPEKAPLRLHSLPGWCRENEPRTSSLRARGFARLARRNFYEEEVVSLPADPLEWACTRPWSAWFLYAIMIWGVGTMVAFLMASFCFGGVAPKFDEQSAADPEETFNSGHFSCLSDYRTCIMAFLCPAMRWADTVQMAGVLSFWFAFWILSACFLPSVAFFFIWGLFPLVPLVMARQHLRDKLHLPSGNETWVSDCCFAFWCCCCLISQEARVVNEAYAVGHTAMPISGGRVG